MLAGHSYEAWIIFHVIVFVLLALDLGVFNRKAHVIRMKEAIGWSIFWVILGLSFSGYIYYDAFHSPIPVPTDGSPIPTAERYAYDSALLYLTGYIVEKSLSVDNLFVFAVIFGAFKIPREHQHRLLFWGVLGAIILRGVMIVAGTALLTQFHWLIYVFGAFLVFTGIKLFKGGEDELDPQESGVVRFAQNFLPISAAPHEGRFTIVENGRRVFTTFFLALLLVESSDVLFALDSVPAVMGVTKDPFLVYTSNIFAILGLRSLFFVLEDMLERFHLLKFGLAIILILVGCKMLGEHFYKVPAVISLAVIFVILATSILLSLQTAPAESRLDSNGEQDVAAASNEALAEKLRDSAITAKPEVAEAALEPAESGEKVE